MITRRGFLGAAGAGAAGAALCGVLAIAKPAEPKPPAPKRYGAADWKPNTAYQVGDVIEFTPGLYGRCAVAGTGAMYSDSGFSGRAVFVPQ